MTKEEAKNKLRQAGYTVIDDNSVVTVIIGADGNIKTTIKAVKEKLKALGYEASFSVRQQKDSENFAKEASATEPDTDSYEEESDIEDAEISQDAEEPILHEEASVEDKEAADEEVTKDDIDKKTDDEDDDTEYFDEEDSAMILGEDAIQFSLDDFGLDF